MEELSEAALRRNEFGWLSSSLAYSLNAAQPAAVAAHAAVVWASNTGGREAEETPLAVGVPFAGEQVLREALPVMHREAVLLLLCRAIQDESQCRHRGVHPPGWPGHEAFQLLGNTRGFR